MSSSLPSKPISSILRQDSTTQHKTLKTILKDVRFSTSGMDKTEQMRVAKTIKQLNEDPTKVMSKDLRKQAIGALRDAGDLRGRFTNNLGAAMKEMDKQAANLNKKTFSELKDMRPSELSPEERKRLKMFKNKMRARAVEEREAAEGSFHAGNHETTRFGLEAWQNSSVSANSTQRRQSGYTLQPTDTQSKKNSSSSKPPMIDMMLD
jgi:hypothetical protein